MHHVHGSTSSIPYLDESRSQSYVLETKVLTMWAVEQAPSDVTRKAIASWLERDPNPRAISIKNDLEPLERQHAE